jgi:8-oxo-dGTP pyrophosphatase MutT (NUDIX family)
MTSADEWRDKGYLVRRGDGRAPWADRVATLPATIGIEQVRAVFAARSAPPAMDPAPHLRTSAVLIALFEEDSQARVVFIHRSHQVGTHRGDVAFPGGVLDPGETPLAAALREAYEEVGIRPADVEVIGRLREFPATGSGFHITPVVGITAARPDYVVSVEEIDGVFDVPLIELFDPARYREEIWRSLSGPPADIPFFEVDGGTIWGATATMLLELLELLAAVVQGS